MQVGLAMSQPPSRLRRIAERVIADWSNHRVTRLGAALAYYSVFSLGPLLLIVTSVAGLLFGQDAVRGALSGQFNSLLGPTGSTAVEAMLKGAAVETTGWITAGIGITLLIVAALGVVVQLKDALNTIWEVEGQASSGLWGYLRTYLVSLAGIVGLGFLLAVSLVVSALLAALPQVLGRSGPLTLVWQLVNFAVSLGVLTLLFAMALKWLPDTAVAWADVWPGAALAALLFNAGKLAIAWYIGTQGLESTYGAAASVVVLLIWVYWSAQILLLGAEVSHASASIPRAVP